MDAQIAEQDVKYSLDGTKMEGFLASPAAVGAPRAGVLIVHEWWGLNDHIKERARKLAGLGYAAFAVDMYGVGKRAATPDEAGALMNEVLSDMALIEARFTAAQQTFGAMPQVDGAWLAAAGYCFGGAVALHMARKGAALKGVASFHGLLDAHTTIAEGTAVPPVRVFTGADDPMVPPETVKGFEQEMASAGADSIVVSYPGVVHAFTNPGATARGEKYGLPLAYDADADEDSWSQLVAFFADVLK